MNNFIPISMPSITQKEIEYVNDAVKSGWVSSLGKYIELFEKSFAEFSNTKYAIAVSNGTTGLHLALEAYGIGPGDEVIVPDLTFIATANAVKHTGANPVFVDIEETTLCIDPESIKKAITKNTKAIIPVHLYGHPANMALINSIAKENGLLVIEDAAEAHGAEFNGERVGSLGDCGVFSFYGNKIITSGEGGMITTNCDDFYQKALRLRDHAMDKSKRYWHSEIGYNYRMTNIQAALGVAQLERIDSFLKRKKEIFDIYKLLLNNIPRLHLNFTSIEAKNVYWMVCLEVEGYEEADRDKLINDLKNEGIDSRPYFYPISDMPMYKRANTPVVHKVYKRGINLPSYFDISESDIKYVCDKIISLLGGR
ncbi:MAG: DegT/DnrJ/EryC1/StrS family aminotransferase [Clostridia bacterium]|nr:DegT/DnrJ/EryC1/StrS family aminotransferase [Clostridia bacterium]